MRPPRPSSWPPRRSAPGGSSSAPPSYRSATRARSGWPGTWRWWTCLSRGRLQVGLSAGLPRNAELLAGLVYDGDWREYDFSHARIARLAQNLRGDFLGGTGTVVPHPAGPQRPRLRPHDPGLAERLWYGAASLGSAVWAAEHGLHLVVANICAGEGLATDDFATAQLTHIRTYRERFAGPGQPRVVADRVIVPTDGADAATRHKYRDYQASRHERTLTPQGRGY